MTIEERVALLIVDGMLDGTPPKHLARAIIPLVLEEAAKVADNYATWHDKHDDGLSGLDKMAEGAREVAEVIRALGETK